MAATEKGIAFYWALLKESVNDFIENDVFTLAAALSYYTVFSLPPIILIIIYTTTSIYSEAAVREMLFDEIGKLVGEDGALQLSTIIDNLNLYDQTWWATALSAGILVFTSTTVFITVQNSLNKIFHVKPKPKRGFVKLILDRFLSFALVLGIALILLISLVVDALVNGMIDLFLSQFPGAAVLVTGVVAFLVQLGIVILLFAIIFKYLPDAKLEWRDTWIGAWVTALLFTVGKLGIGFYLGNSNTANVYDAAGSLVIIMLWVFYASIIFLFGAVFTYVYAGMRNRNIEPASYAVRVEQREIIVQKGEDAETDAEQAAR